MFEDLPLLDDYELVKKRFFHVKDFVGTDMPDVMNAFITMRDDFSEYFHIPKTKTLECIMNYFDGEFFLLMPVFNTYLQMKEVLPIEIHLTMFIEEGHKRIGKEKWASQYGTCRIIQQFLNFISNLK